MKTVKCNNCSQAYSESELELIITPTDSMKTCPICKTDEYLMNLDDTCIPQDTPIEIPIQNRWMKEREYEKL